MVGPLSSAYKEALGRYAGRRKEAKAGFLGAEAPLEEAVEMFRPGGKYGAGQRALIEKQGRKTYAGGLSNLIATGMGSGTNVAGLRARVGADVGEAKLGVEDVRIDRLTQALELLSQLKGQAAGALAGMQEPSYAPYVGALTSAYGAYSGEVSDAISRATQYNLAQKQMAQQEKIAKMELAATEKATTPRQHFNTPW